MIASNIHDKQINIVGDELFAIHQNYMPLYATYWKSGMGSAYLFCCCNKDEIKAKVGNSGRFFFAEMACKDAEKASKFISFLAMPGLALLGIGIFSLIIYFVLGIVRSIKAKKIDTKYFASSLILFLGIVLIGGVTSYQSSIDSKRQFQESNQFDDIGEYSTNIVDKFIEISNIFYEISVIEEKEPFDEQFWLSKMMVAKKKNENLLNELKSIKIWSIPRNSHLPRYEDIIPPAIEMCKRLEKYFDLSTNASSNIEEQKLYKAESYAEFSELLEKLPDALVGAVENNGAYMKDILNKYNRFDKDALAKFQSMDNDSPDTKYNIKLIFGHRVYKVIKEKAEAEEGYEKREALLENK